MFFIYNKFIFVCLLTYMYCLERVLTLYRSEASDVSDLEEILPSTTDTPSDVVVSSPTPIHNEMSVVTPVVELRPTPTKPTSDKLLVSSHKFELPVLKSVQKPTPSEKLESLRCVLFSVLFIFFIILCYILFYLFLPVDFSSRVLNCGVTVVCCLL